jgi:transposase
MFNADIRIRRVSLSHDLHPLGSLSKMPIDEKARWAIIFKYQELKVIEATARACGVSREVARRWIRRYEATGGVQQLQKSGRKPSLSAAGASRAEQLLVNEETGGAFRVALQLLSEGYTTKRLHKSTIISAAKEAARRHGAKIHCVRGRPAKRLTADTKSKRLQFAKANERTSWANVMFTDRKKFHFSYPGAKVFSTAWVYKGNNRQATTVNHPQCVNLYAGITKYGVTSCHLVAGTSKQQSKYTNKKGQRSKNITAGEYQDVLKATLLPEGKRIFNAKGVAQWQLQQDNDPSHREEPVIIQEWSSSHSSSITVLGKWPPNSPDLNPIENVWAYVQGKVNSLGCKSFEEFKVAVLDQVKAVPLSMLNNLFNSMPKRMAKVIELEGDKTKY